VARPAWLALLEEGGDALPEVVAGLHPLDRRRGFRPVGRVGGVVLRGECGQAGGDRDRGGGTDILRQLKCGRQRLARVGDPVDEAQLVAAFRVQFAPGGSAVLWPR
jgi:hypothetical protein